MAQNSSVDIKMLRTSKKYMTNLQKVDRDMMRANTAGKLKIKGTGNAVMFTTLQIQVRTWLT